MGIVGRGRVHGGGIVFEEPLKLPEGTQVSVRIEPIESGTTITPPVENASLAVQPFVGMWADREDMTDSADWVEKERAKWQQRVARPD